MRIISGMRKGLKLKSPNGMGTRPTTDRVKESIFNIIQFHLPVPNVLDLFAGSGAIGIEALSRGCEHSVFVEQDHKAAEVIKENLMAARMLPLSKMICGDALRFLQQCQHSFDLIFLDPPYNRGLLDPVLALIDRRSLLNPGGLIVVETEKNGESVAPQRFETIKTAVYGKTVITILQETRERS